MRSSMLVRWGACCALAMPAVGFAQSAEELLGRAERRVQVIDSIDRTFSGSFRQVVAMTSEFGPDHSTVVDSFDVRVHNGIQESRKSLSGGKNPSAMRLPPNCTSVFALHNVLFPFRRGSATDVSVQRTTDSSIAGRPCNVITFDFHARSDSAHARGAGRLWLAQDDATPLMVTYDLQGRHPRRGDFLTAVHATTRTVGTRVVIDYNSTHVRFFMEGSDLGREEANVISSHFVSR